MSDEEFISRILKKKNTRTFLSVQWLKLWVYTAGGSGSIPGGEDGTGIPNDTQFGQGKKKKKKNTSRTQSHTHKKPPN